jgi:hypothetical protein
MATASEGANQSPYRNQPLRPGEIRLLTIEPANLQHVFPWLPLEFRIVTTCRKLEDKPDFDAVSYVWGTTPASISIPCNDGSILVTPTAHHMLGFLRLQKGPLWIDALCINQGDEVEKATQIPLMRQIYANASYVVVWMGALTSAVERFMLEFPRVLLLAESWTPYHPSGTEDLDWRGADWPAENDAFWVGAYHLLHNEWFRRLWTFQEIVLAREAVFLVEHCWIYAYDLFAFIRKGSFTSGGFMFFNPVTASRIVNKAVVPEFAFKACLTIIYYNQIWREESFATPIRTTDIAHILHSLRSRSVKERVDRVWAIAGLLEQNLQDQLMPLVDYSEQGRMEYWRTYVHFTKAVIVTGQSLSLLSLPPTGERPDSALPTWCADFSKPGVCLFVFNRTWNLPVHIVQPAKQLLLVAGGDDVERSHAKQNTILNHPKKSTWVSEDGRWLHTCGFTVDTISEVVEAAPPAVQTGDPRDSSWAQWKEANPDHTAVMTVLARALSLACRVSSRSNNNGPLQYFLCCLLDYHVTEDIERAYEDALVMMKSGGYHYYMTLDPVRREQGYAWTRQLTIITGHSFFATEGGRFGIAHPGCEAGDKVCTFYGGETLYILRWPQIEGLSSAEHVNEPATYRGAAFIPYLMEQHERDGARLGDDEMFTIR